MSTAEQAYNDIIAHIEENRLEAAIAALLSFAQQDSPDKTTAVRMRRSDLKTLEEEALIMGESAGIRERRSTLKLQLFRLADAIHQDTKNKAASAPPPVSGASEPVAVSPYSTPRGEGPVKVFLSYASEPADQAGGEELRKSMALLLHLKKVEIFDQQKSPAGNRDAALRGALNEAEAILLLLSNNFLSSLECLGIQQDAYNLYQQNRAIVIPVLFNPCEWKDLDIGRLQALPREGKFITQWDNTDEAYTRISREVNVLAKSIRERLDYSAASPQTANKAKPVYNTDELRDIFRKGNPEELIQQLIRLTRAEKPLYDQVLLLEQRWHEISEDEKYNTASVESITIRTNKLKQSLLGLIREMEG
ncbi:MAG: TIR domain-containing protein [Phaeodactylibacter sp.]|nr:TIR domain-containing protein [Phaeodactylibacter sp.]MCB9052883.1 TIR domain-containing protein [Lewinellaceae bacterium]